MKKILGISLVAVLAISPLMAFADPVAGDPDTDANAPVATHAPKYELQAAHDNDANVATAGYVKGAYNAAIRGVNKVHEEVVSANTAIQTISNTLSSTYATKTGAAATINSAQTSGSFSNAAVSASFTNAAVSGTVSGSASGTIAAMTTWGSNTPGTVPATASITSGTVSGSASGTVSGTASGNVSGTVSGASASAL